MVIKIKGVLLAEFWILFWFSAEASGFLSIVSIGTWNCSLIKSRVWMFGTEIPISHRDTA